MKTSFHRIITEDGIELVGLLYEPEEKTETILVHVHGMAGNFYENSFLDFLAKTLTSNNIAFFSFNNRGCELVKDLTKFENGKKSIVRIGSAYEKFEDCIFDIKVAVDFATDQGYSRIHLSGHSLGTPKVAYYVAEAGDRRLISMLLLSPSDMVGLIEMDKNYEKDMAEAKQMLSEGRGGELLSSPVLWDQNFFSSQTYVSLGDRASKVAIFNFYDKDNTLPVLSKITIPVTAIMGKKDDALVVPVEQTLDRIKEATSKSPKVTTTILGEATHGYTGFEQQLADTVCSWIKELD